MGGGSWSSNAYNDAKRMRKSLNASDFSYSDDAMAGRVNSIHESLDPKKVAGPSSVHAGLPIRESRDNAEHPTSLPIAVIFDVTGSMRNIPMTLQQKLPKLMDVILEKSEVSDPQILVGAVGDFYADRFPLQVGQFESDNRFDEQLRNIILEGGGGGQVKESYGLAYWFAADHTATDSFELRGKKGYLFTMGDEKPHDLVTAKEVNALFGIGEEGDESVESVLQRAQEKWEIFHLGSLDGSYRDRDDIHQRWADLLGERYIKVEDSAMICEIIAGIVHMIESAYDVDRVVADIGLKGKDAACVTNALAPLSKTLPAHIASGSLPAGHSTAGGSISRI